MTRTRKNYVPALLAVALVAVVAVGCASSTKFTSTWKEPGAGPIDVTGQKVAVFVISPHDSVRRSGETLMAKEITERGAQGVAGYTLMSPEEVKDVEIAKAKLEEGNFDAVLTIHAVDSKQETTWTPGTSYAAWPGYYGSWGGYWGYGWGMAYDPGYMRTDTIVSVETMIYDVESGEPIWAGRSETTNPDELSKAISDLADELGDELVKSGLLTQ